MGNRYGHLPAAGLALAAASLASRALSGRLRPGLAAALAGAALSWLLVGVVDEVRAWSSDLTLYGRALAMAPRDGCARYHYGIAVLRRDGCGAALEHFEAATSLAPEYARGWHNTAGCLLRMGRAEEAIEPARRALALDPSDPRKMSNLGAALLRAGSREEGARWLRRPSRATPTTRPPRRCCASADAAEGGCLRRYSRAALGARSATGARFVT